MARVQVNGQEIEVSETTDDVLRRAAEAEQRPPTRGGQPIGPLGWVILTHHGTGDTVYVQASCIGYVRD